MNIRTLTLLTVIGLAAPAVPAQGPDAALLTAAASPLNDDVRSSLLSGGAIGSVTVFDVQSSTPTLAQLLQYDAVLTWCYASEYDDSAALGDVLADYVDAGGGVVVAIATNTSPLSYRRLEGRWLAEDYEIVRSGGGEAFGPSTALGAILIPAHPIMDGVTSFDGGRASLRPQSPLLSPHGVVVAEWSDGKILVAVSSEYPGRVDLGFYPVSDAAHPSAGWISSTEGARLLANALVYASEGGGDCYADCDGSDNLDFFDFLCFQNLFAAGDPLADCDGSGTPDFFDFLCFQNEFAAGCP